MPRALGPSTWIPLALLGPLLVLALIYTEYERRQEQAMESRAAAEQEALSRYIGESRALHDEFAVSLLGAEIDPGLASRAQELESVCRRIEGARVQAEHYLATLRSREFPAEARPLHFWLEREMVAYLDYVVALDLFCAQEQEGYLEEALEARSRGAEAGRRAITEFARLAPESPLAPAVWALRPTPQPTPPALVVGADLANVRACPRLDCEIVATLEKGRPVIVVEELEGQTVLQSPVWFRVAAEGLPDEAYMHLSVFAPGAAAASGGSSVATEAPATPAP